MSKDNKHKPWGGRFTAPTDEFVEQFTQSVSYDQRLAHYDIMGSIAHVRMLARVKVLSDDECEQIVAGLNTIQQRIEQDTFSWSTALEDVHMNIETALVAEIGDFGKKLHTGRSRNDQVATDIRLYCRAEVDAIHALLTDVLKSIHALASQHVNTIMPGFTHLQSAQPVTFGHHLLAWAEMLLRDRDRLQDCRRRINLLPLGAAALAGTSYPIDRESVASELGFDGVTQNSLDSVSDRDFVIELAAACSLIMMHLSRFSEELIIWMSQASGFIEIGDAWCTGSSIMPQKKNPDIPELVRGKTGRVYGSLMSLLTLMKAQPLAYNRDNQEDKEALFDALDTVKMCLLAYSGMVPTITVNKATMYEAAAKGFATATDLADYLVVNGLPFRDAHEAVGKIVQFAIQADKPLDKLTLQELQQFCDVINDEVFAVLTLEGSVAARNHIGGTAPTQVEQALSRLEQMI